MPKQHGNASSGIKPTGRRSEEEEYNLQPDNQSKMQKEEYFIKNACYSVTKSYLCKQNNKRSLLGRKQRSQVVRSFPNRYQFSCTNKVTSLFSDRYIFIIIFRYNSICLAQQTSVSETSEWLDILSGYKFFCSFIVVKKRSNSSVCKTRNKHRVATRIVFLRTLCFKPKAVVKAKHILFYYRADCLSLQCRCSGLRKVAQTHNLPIRI